jgi:hypothetical protein
MRLLLARAGALGDLLLLRRGLAAARRAGHAVTLLAPAPGALLAGDGPAAAERHLDWEAREMTALLGGGRLPPGAWRDDLDACDIALACTRRVDVVHALSRRVPITLALDPQAPPGAGPAWSWLARPLAAFGIDTGVAPPPLVASDAERDAARPWRERLPERFLALHPGSGGRAKNWPFERFLELADAIAPDQPWLLVLGPAEIEWLDDARLPPRAVVARELPLRTLAALLADAGLFVGNDAGVTHLAAACGIATLALFGPTDPETWAPDGVRVATLRAPGGDLAALHVEAVRTAAEQLTARGTASRETG